MIEPITDIEAYFAQMRAEEEAANANVHPDQAALTWGDHFVRFYEMGPEGILAIFGAIYTASDYERSEGAQGLAEAEERMARGYRFARCYSVIEPEGELGDTHVVTVWPITPEQFAQAKAAGWDPGALPWLATLGPSDG